MLGLWGRRASRAVSTLSCLAMGVGGIYSGISVFWLLFVLTLQRGPIQPCSDEARRGGGRGGGGEAFMQT